MSVDEWSTIHIPSHESSTTLAAAVARARTAGAAGEYREAFDLLLDLADAVHRRGLPHLVFDIERLVDEIIPASAVTDVNRAWMLHAVGKAQSALGRHLAAAHSFETMKTIGVAQADPDIIGTANLNLGNQAHLAGDYERAREFFAESLSSALAQEEFYAATQVIHNISALLIGIGQLDEAQRLLDLASAYIASGGDSRLRAIQSANQAMLAAKRGEYAEAERLFRRSLRQARALNDGIGEVKALQNLGAVSLDQGHVSLALRRYRRALAAAMALNLPESSHAIVQGLATALLRAGREADAAVYLERSRSLAEELDDRGAWAHATADLGALSIRLGNTDRAIPLINEALTVFREQGDVRWQVRGLRNLSEAYRVRGDVEAAASLAEEALALSPEDAHEDRAALLWCIAVAWVNRRDVPQANAYFERSLIEERFVDDFAHLASRLGIVAAHFASVGAYEASLPYYTRALEIYDGATDMPLATALAFHIRNDRAIALTALERFDEARRDYQSCLRTASEREDRAMALQASMNIGEMERRARRYNDAIGHLSRARDLARELEDDRSEAVVLGLFGIAMTNVADWDGARRAFKNSLTLAEATGNLSARATATGGLAGVAFGKGKYQEAATLYRRAARLNERADKSAQFIEDLAGLTESLSALGYTRRTEATLQRLVEAAQDGGDVKTAADGIARSARWWLKTGKLSEAANLYRIAVSIVANELSSDSSLVGEERRFADFVRVLMLIDFHIRAEPGLEQDAFYDRLVRSLDDHQESLGTTLQPIFQTVHSAWNPPTT